MSTFSMLFAAAGFLSIGAAAHAVEIVAHRGASYDAPENTLAAFELAWEQEADAIECDVHLAGDGRIIVSHDATTKRTTGVDWRIAERTVQELQTLDAGAWKNPQWQGQRLPLLTEVLRIVPPGKKILIEIKCGPEIMPELVRVLAAADLASEQITIISFHESVIAAAKQRLPHLRAYWLFGFKRDKQTGQWNASHEQVVERARRVGADGLSVSANEQVTADLAALVREADLELHVWTVNDPAVARRMVDLGAVSITTDRPKLIREHLGAERPGQPPPQP